MTDITLSVIIPVYNSSEMLEHCLDALRKSSRPADEIIVVDDGSTENMIQKNHQKERTTIRIKDGPRGPAYARNRGVEKATGDILVFIDSDVTVHKETLDLIEKKFKGDPDLSALFGSYNDSPAARDTISLFKNLLHHHVHQQNGGKAYTFWAGCGAIKRPIFNKIGGFSEHYNRPSVEDIELGYRLSLKNYRIHLYSDIQVTHLKHWTFLNMIRTDIFARAIPWTKLLCTYKNIPCHLNIDIKSRLSAFIAGLTLLSLIALIYNVLFILPLTLLLLTQIFINRDLFGCFLKKGGFIFLIKTIVLHGLYLIYSSVAYTLTRCIIEIKNRILT